MQKHEKLQRFNSFKEYDIITQEEGAWVERPDYCVGAEVIIMEHEEEFIMGQDYIPCLKGFLGMITRILSDRYGNHVYRVEVYDHDDKPLLFFEHEICVIDGWRYFKEEHIMKLHSHLEEQSIWVGDASRVTLHPGGLIKYNEETKEILFINPNQGRLKYRLSEQYEKLLLRRIGIDLYVVG